LQPLANVLPVDDLPKGFYPFALGVFVLQVISVLPHVQDEQRYCTIANVSLVVVYLLDHEPLAERLPCQRAPAPALEIERGLIELVLEIGYRTEPFFDSVG